MLLSYGIAAQPMDLVFSRAEIISVVFAAFIVNQIAAEGKSTWFGGVQLLAVYTIIAISFYCIPWPGFLHEALRSEMVAKLLRRVKGKDR